MQSKYKRLTAPRAKHSADAGYHAPEQARPVATLEESRWGEQTYLAARELREAASKNTGWLPFSAPGLSVGPSMLRNHLRVDLHDQHGEPHSLLVSSVDLARWLNALQ